MATDYQLCNRTTSHYEVRQRLLWHGSTSGQVRTVAIGLTYFVAKSSPLVLGLQARLVWLHTVDKGLRQHDKDDTTDTGCPILSDLERKALWRASMWVFAPEHTVVLKCESLHANFPVETAVSQRTAADVSLVVV
eukprot:2527816-Amphidinium_carterae.1